MGEKHMGSSTNDLVNDSSSNRGSNNGDYGESRKLPQYIAALSVCIGSMGAGTVLGWTSNIEQDIKTGKLNDILVTTDEFGWIGSFSTLGALCMCFPIGFICDLIGRKLAMLLTIIPFTIGWLLIIFAQDVGMIYAGRFLTGLAGGAFCVSAPLYTSEISQKEIRGALGSYFQLLLTVGILLAYLVGAFLEPQITAVICGIVPLVFGLVFFFQPETPVYSLKKNDEKSARLALRRLRGPKYNVDLEIEDIKRQLERDRQSNISFMASFKKRATKRSLVICFGLMFFQQLSGVNAVIFYTGNIFETAGAALASSDATILVGCIQVIATFISSLVVDKFGRKILLLGSDFFMAIASLLLGIFYTLKDRNVLSDSEISDISFLPILALCMFIISFSLGFGPIPWMLSSEVFPQEIKSNASSAASTFNWFLAFIVTRFYLNLNEAIGGDSTFYIFTAVSLVGTAFVFFFVPETKGKTFDEIQNQLNGGPIGTGASEPTRLSNGNDRNKTGGIDNQGFSSQ